MVAGVARSYGNQMRRLLATLVAVALAAILALGGLLFAALDGKPLVARDETITTDAIDQARRLLLANDPRRLREGEERVALIPATLLDEAINYAASRALYGRGALALADASADVRLSVQVPGVPGYVNLRLTVAEAAGEPHLAAARLGNVPLPAAVLEHAFDRVRIDQFNMAVERGECICQQACGRGKTFQIAGTAVDPRPDLHLGQHPVMVRPVERGLFRYRKRLHCLSLAMPASSRHP